MNKYIVTADCGKGDTWTRQVGESTSLEEMMHLFKNYLPAEETTMQLVRVFLTSVTINENGDTSKELIEMRRYEISYLDEDDLD